MVDISEAILLVTVDDEAVVVKLLIDAVKRMEEGTPDDVGALVVVVVAEEVEVEVKDAVGSISWVVVWAATSAIVSAIASIGFAIIVLWCCSRFLNGATKQQHV